MGSHLSTESSAESRFLHTLQDELASRKVYVSKADLAQFFTVIHKASPWFLITAPQIAVPTWNTIREELVQFCDKQDDPAFTRSILTYWQILDGVLTAAPLSSSCAKLIKEGQEILAAASRSHTPVSPSPSSQSRPPPYAPPPTTSAPPAPSSGASAIPSSSSSFVALSREDDRLSPEDEATLEDAAAAYDSRRQFPPISAPPPPIPPLTAPPVSADPPSTPIPPVVASAAPFLQDSISKLCSSLQESLCSALKDTLSSSLHPRSTSGALQAFPCILGDPPSAPSAPRHRMETRSRAAGRRRRAAAADGGAEAASAAPDGNDPDAIQEDPEAASDEEAADADHSPDRSGRSPSPPPRRPGRVLQENKQFKDLDQSSLKEVRKAVLEYGPQAPYTLSCLEALAYGSALFPEEWRVTVRRCFKPAEIMLWQAEFSNNCRELAGGSNNKYRRIFGAEPYNTVAAQKQLPYASLALTSQAALKAWKAVGSSSGPQLPLAKIQQADDEPYHAFISRLLEAIERTTGITDTTNPFVKQLAFENANPACRQILKGPKPSRTLEEMISLCKSAHSFATQVAGALIAFQGQNQGRVCFSCGKPGHFAGKCPERKPDVLAGSTSERPPLCSRCRRGRHWRNRCRATTDIQGNFLGENPLLHRNQGNANRGQPPAPRSQPRPISFVPATGATAGTYPPPQQVLYQQHLSSSDPTPPPSSGPPPVQQDSTCVPPPRSY